MGIPPPGYFCKQRDDVERTRSISGALATDFVVVVRTLITRKSRGIRGCERVPDAKRYATKRILSVTYAIR